jgi:hypothetical protein
MKLANITINQIIKIINDMSYAKVKDSLCLWDSPIKVKAYCQITHDMWDYQIFKETNKIQSSYRINSITIMMYNPDHKQYDQDVTLTISIDKNIAKLFYRNKKQGINTEVKSFHRNIKQLQECVLNKMNDEVKKTQMRISHAKINKNKEHKKLIKQITISV